MESVYIRVVAGHCCLDLSSLRYVGESLNNGDSQEAVLDQLSTEEGAQPVIKYIAGFVKDADAKHEFEAAQSCCHIKGLLLINPHPMGQVRQKMDSCVSEGPVPNL